MLVLFIALGGCTTLSGRVVDDPTEGAETFRRSRDLRSMVDALAGPLIDRGETPGLIVGVRLPDGSRHVYGYGSAGPGAPAPSADTVFAVGSVTKTMVGAVAELQVRRGVIGWDDTLRDILPAHVALSPDAARITLRQLAGHVSGLPRQPRQLRMLWLLAQYPFNGRDFYRRLDRDSVYRFLAEWKSPDPPGEPVQRYSNVGFALLAHALELRTGMSIDALVERELVEPLGLRSTTFDPSRIDPSQVRAAGHAGDQPKFIRRGRPTPDWRMNDFMRGTGGVYSTTEDLLQYLDAHFADDPSPMHRALEATLRADPTRVAWLPAEPGNDALVFQFGVIAGYSAYLGLDTQRGIAVVVLQNSFNWTDHVGLNLLRRLAKASDLDRLERQAAGSGR